MRTAKPISSISWNTPEFLENVCNELVKSNSVAFWAYICHQGEPDDEAGTKKNHIHLYLEPTKTIQTVSIRDLFREPVMGNKPLGCLDFRPSVWSDWYLYGLHDEQYLVSKATTRQYHYSPADMHYSDEGEYQYRVRMIRMQSRPVDRLKDYVKSGKSWDDMVIDGLVPLGNFRNFENAFFALKRAWLERNSGSSDNLDQKCPSAELPFDGEISTGKINFGNSEKKS